MRLKQYIGPTSEPIHLTEAKLHLNLAPDAAEAVLDTRENDLLSSVISAARIVAETEQWRSLVLQSFDLYLDAWPLVDEIILPRPPLRKVESVQYTDSAGTVTAFTDFSTDTDSEPGRIVLNYEKTWPSATLAPKNPIRIRYWCGYAIPFTAEADTDIITALNNPLSDDDMVRLSVSGGSLPTGLAIKTDYYVINAAGNTFQLSATFGGAAVTFTTDGTGNMFIGEIPKTTIAGMKLVLADLYEERADTATGRAPIVLPRAATHLFAMDTAKYF